MTCQPDEGDEGGARGDGGSGGGMGVYGIVADGGAAPESASLSRPRYSSRPTISTAASSATSNPTAIHNTTSAITASPIRSIDRPVLNDATETFGRLYR